MYSEGTWFTTFAHLFHDSLDNEPLAVWVLGRRRQKGSARPKQATTPHPHCQRLSRHKRSDPVVWSLNCDFVVNYVPSQFVNHVAPHTLVAPTRKERTYRKKTAYLGVFMSSLYVVSMRKFHPDFVGATSVSRVTL